MDFKTAIAYIPYVILGILPSFVWLVFYLQKDRRPEPKTMILKVFFWGMMMGPVALIFQLAIRWLCDPTTEWSIFFASLGQNNRLLLLNVLIFAPLTEEFVKYLVVRQTVLKNPAFDEPVDAMIYMVVSALGFAAIENIVNIFSDPQMNLEAASYQMIARFLSATFLHTLASAVLGYFMALSMIDFKKRKIIFIAGFALAAAMHGFYNYLILLFDKADFMPQALAIFLLFVATVVFWQFKRLKKLLAVCRVR